MEQPTEKVPAGFVALPRGDGLWTVFFAWDVVMIEDANPGAGRKRACNIRLCRGSSAFVANVIGYDAVQVGRQVATAYTEFIAQAALRETHSAGLEEVIKRIATLAMGSLGDVVGPLVDKLVADAAPEILKRELTAWENPDGEEGDPVAQEFDRPVGKKAKVKK